MKKINLDIIIMLGIIVLSLSMGIYYNVSGIEIKNPKDIPQISSENDSCLQIGKDITPITLEKKSSALDYLRSISIFESKRDNSIEYKMIEKNPFKLHDFSDLHPNYKEIMICDFVVIITLLCLVFSICYGKQKENF